MGFKLSVFLGAAGILTVAIGFASQTSASNLISGLFLIGEGAFTIGDWIKIGETEGEVLAIDLLSIKLRTIDNLYIRIPNESIIKTPVTNLTRFPIRRVTLTLSVAYEEDIGKVRQLLMRIADQFPLVLNEPRPQVTLQRFADASFDVLFVVWVARENFVTVRDGLHERIKDAFDARERREPVNTEPLSVTRPSGEVNLGIVFETVPDTSWLDDGDKSALLLYVRDAVNKSSVSSSVAKELFDFTPAETALALELANGLSLEDTAEKLGIMRNTARAHLRAIFSKTGVRRQAELVRVMLNSVVALSGNVVGPTHAAKDIVPGELLLPLKRDS